ncbi:MAG: hypothetical protein K0S35_2312 [Geminicoccaceae bacterium]|nr:hypothetical protein [Geminicoccaceae bacterium]
MLELDAEVLADHLAAGQDRDVLEHRLAPVAEARRLDRGHLQAAAQLVDHERGERLALDVLGDDQERPAGLDDLLEHRQERLQARELLLVEQDDRLLELDRHLLGVGDEVGREIAAVELHALDHLELGQQALGLLDGDHAFLADLLHRLRDHLADARIAVGGDGADLGDLGLGGDRARVLLDLLDHDPDRLVDAALEVHRVHTGGHRLGALAHDRLGEHGRGGGAVTGLVGGLARDLAQHLRAHVLEAVGELDLLGDGHPVLGDPRRAERLLEDDVAPLGPERHLDGIGQHVDAPQHLGAGVGVEFDLFRSH